MTNNTLTVKNFKFAKRTRGYVLLGILVLGVASISLMLALAQVVTAVYRDEGRRRNLESLRNAAEVGVDYAIAQLNIAAADGTTAVVDCGTDPSKTTALPTGYLNTTIGGASNASSNQGMQVTVTVKRVPSWTNIAKYSSIYAPQLDPANSVSSGYLNPMSTNIKQDNWRVLESRAANSTASKTIRVLLKPRYDLPPGDDGSGVPGGSTPNRQSFFNFAMFGNHGLNLAPTSGNLQVQGFDPVSPSALSGEFNQTGGTYNYNLTVSSNQAVNLDSNLDLRGNIQVSNQTTGGAVVTNNGSTAEPVKGTLTANGTVSNLQGADGPTANPGDTVVANADKAGSGNPGAARTGGNLNPIQETPVAQNAMAPAPTANQNTPSLPDLNSTANITGGADYQTSTLDTSGVTTPVTTGSSGSAINPVRIFVQGQSTNPSAVNLNTAVFSNASTDPRNLQIFYQGNKSITINVDPANGFKGIIYAPNAAVNVVGNGNFEGGIVAGTVNGNLSGTMKMRTDLSDPTSSSAAGSLNKAANLTYLSRSGSGTVLRGYSPVTWQEIR